jgi:hypothetical protein
MFQPWEFVTHGAIAQNKARLLARLVDDEFLCGSRIFFDCANLISDRCLSGDRGMASQTQSATQSTMQSSTAAQIFPLTESIKVRLKGRSKRGQI